MSATLVAMHRWGPYSDGDPLLRRGLLVIGQAIIRWRMAASMSQRQLAFQAGVNQSTISRLERGQLRAMRLISLARVIGALNLPPELLVPGGPPPASRRLPGQPR